MKQSKYNHFNVSVNICGTYTPTELENNIIGSLIKTIVYHNVKARNNSNIVMTDVMTNNIKPRKKLKFNHRNNKRKRKATCKICRVNKNACP